MIFLILIDRVHFLQHDRAEVPLVISCRIARLSYHQPPSFQDYPETDRPGRTHPGHDRLELETHRETDHLEIDHLERVRRDKDLPVHVRLD
jgi:hypothetical protein